MKQYVWIGVMVGWVGFAASGCTVKQQESVLGTIGTVIPGSKGSMFGTNPETERGRTQSRGRRHAPRWRIPTRS